MSPKKMTPDRKKKLKKLASMMNKQNERFIPLAPPIIEMMDMVIEAGELDYLIGMRNKKYSYDQAIKLSDMSEKKFKPFFEQICRKGFVHVEFDAEKKPVYRLNAIAVGWYESQMHYLVGKPEEKAFSKKFQEYFNFFKKFNFPPVRETQNIVLRPFLKSAQSVGIIDPETDAGRKKIIPINLSASSPETKIYPTNFVTDLIEEHGKKNAIAVFRCVCRHGANVLGHKCKQKMPEESCIAFGDAAKMWVSYGYGRHISKSNAMDILQEVREKGAVHSVIHEKDDIRLPAMAICNCCWDCCGILKPYNMGAVPLSYKSYFIARIKKDSECKGCGKCERHCPTTAISVKDKKMTLNSAKCIGCGQCAYHCKDNHIELVPDERKVFLPLLKKSEIRITA